MRKVQLTIKQEEVAPATTSDLVVMNNGKTLKEELSTSVLDKFSREVTVNSPMSKIIDGALDGVYESCVFKGRTLVNVLGSCKFSLVKTEEGKSVTRFLPLNPLIKPNTKYLYVINVLKNTLTSSNNGSVMKYCETDSSKVSSSTCWEWMNHIYPGFTGVKKHIMTTKPVFEGVCELSDRIEIYGATDVGGVIEFETFVVEYQEGMEEWDIPYFEGLCDSKMPILRNIGKNLFEDNVVIQGYHNGSDTFYNDSNFITYKNPISVVPNTEYIFGNNIQTRYGRINFYDKNMKIISSITDQNLSPFTTPSNCHFVRFSTYRNTGIKPSEIIWSQLEVGRIATPYEPYKTNILHTPETVTLRSLPNGVRDELNLKTGEHIKRIGEVVLNGSEEWLVFDTVTNARRFRHKPLANTKEVGTVVCISDRLPTYLRVETGQVISSYTEHVGIEINNQELWMYTEETKNMTTSDFKAWLQQNPITVQYELALPVVTKAVLTGSEPIVKVGIELPNGVCDTYNLSTGEYIQRIKRVVLDGSEGWLHDKDKTDHLAVRAKISGDMKAASSTDVAGIVSDKFQTDSASNVFNNAIEGIAVNGRSEINISILKSKLTTNSVNGFKEWLRNNPTAVWYELKNPIITKKKGIPETYGIKLLNGVGDKYNELESTYTQNIGKVLLTGEESWILGIAETENHITFAHDIPNGKVGHCVLSDRFETQYISSTNSNPIRDEESIICGNRFSAIAGRINITIAKSKLSTPDVAGFIAWLKENPTTVYHELNTPDTFTVYRINVGKVLPNGVCDTYDPITKTYTQNIEETVLNGDDSVTYQLEMFDNRPSNTIAVSILNIDYIKQGNGQITSDKIQFGTSSLDGLESILYNHEFKKITIEISKSRLTEPNLASFKQWLQRNPLTVWYQMANSAAYNIDIDLSILHTSTPMIYKNGHIILESSYDGPSLLPEFVYSVPTSKSGVLSTTSKTILKHEQRLHQFEDLLLRESLLMDYRLTLAMLDSM